MTSKLLVYFVVSLLICLTTGYQISQFQQKKDHYGLIKDPQQENNGEAFFNQRFILVDDYFNEKSEVDEGKQVELVTSSGIDLEALQKLDLSQKNHTIFLYTGGPGPIEEFYENSGYVLELAKYYGALVFFVEHRFYGESLPFGESSFDESYLPYLSVDQVTADYMYLIYFYKYALGISDAQIITFGSFYAGSLASYMRFKYPDHITGALASGAPLRMADEFETRSSYWETVTSIFKGGSEVGDKVVALVESGFDTLHELSTWSPRSQGYAQITTLMNTCEAVNDSNYQDLLKIIRNSFAQLALLNYPFPANGFPANTVKVASGIVYDAPRDVDALHDVVAFYYGTDKDDCIDIEDPIINCADPTGCYNGTRGVAWDFQLCWEYLPEIGSSIDNSMFANLPWTKEDLDAYCGSLFSGLPEGGRYQWFKINYWGSKVFSASNVIWTNGQLDPWFGTGIITNSSTPSLNTLSAIPGASHGLDLMTPVEGDGMGKYREMELELIGQILDGTFPSS